MPNPAPWLDVMVRRLGIVEISGAGHNPVILEWFAAIGHPEIEADEVSWCAVCVGSALKESGLPIPPTATNMLARSYLQYGKSCEPKVGAIAIWPRGKAWQGHVNIVERVLPDGRVICIGGNQGRGEGEPDGVTRTRPMDPAKALGFRWPVAATIPDLREAGSTEVKAGDRIQKWGLWSAVIAPIIAWIKDIFAPIADSVALPAISTPQEGLTALQTATEMLNAVAKLVADNPWLVGCLVGAGAAAIVGRGLKMARVKRAAAGAPLSSEMGT